MSQKNSEAVTQTKDHTMFGRIPTTPTVKQQGFEVVDAQLSTSDITAKLDRIEQARVYRVPVVWLPDVASKDYGEVHVPTALYQLLLY